MKGTLVALGTALLITGGCADDRDPVGPSARHLDRMADVDASTARRVETSGSFLAQVDFSSLTLTPRGRNCLLTVNGRLVFTGTIQGTATGTTEALVFAPCSQVATTPPGTFADVFKSALVFDGTIDGEPATANLLYMGRVRPPGTIDGRLVFSNGAAGRLEADAVVAAGGTYQGSLVVH